MVLLSISVHTVINYGTELTFGSFRTLGILKVAMVDMVSLVLLGNAAWGLIAARWQRLRRSELWSRLAAMKQNSSEKRGLKGWRRRVFVLRVAAYLNCCLCTSIVQYGTFKIHIIGLLRTVVVERVGERASQCWCWWGSLNELHAWLRLNFLGGVLISWLAAWAACGAAAIGTKRKSQDRHMNIYVSRASQRKTSAIIIREIRPG